MTRGPLYPTHDSRRPDTFPRCTFAVYLPPPHARTASASQPQAHSLSLTAHAHSISLTGALPHSLTASQPHSLTTSQPHSLNAHSLSLSFCF
mmetsp:Transcript_69408/g.137643  ORF Transcript_69408/g.137643 Transcript_69408/m.137643 type:complete len:92 (+) Transcript_69408:1082-1357(+)